MDILAFILEVVRTLAWPTVVLIVFHNLRPQLVSIAARLKSANIPGGISIDLAEEIRTAMELSTEVTRQKPPKGKEETLPIPQPELNARMLSLGLDPSPTGLNLDKYRSLAMEDPNLALAGIRLEMEIIGRNLARGFHVDIADSRSITSIYRQLYDAAALTEEQYKLANQILKVSNAAVHGSKISEKEANNIIDVAEILSRQYIHWLSWR